MRLEKEDYLVRQSDIHFYDFDEMKAVYVARRFEALWCLPFDVGGFFCDFELFRTASGPSRLASMASSRDRAFMKPSTRCHVIAMLRAGTTSTDAMRDS